MPQGLAPVAVLFARHDSVYFGLSTEVFDAARDARNYSGSLPVVAHPPCAQWGSLAWRAHDRPDLKQLAFVAVEQVRRCGGVLEHPAFSKLWPAAGLPAPGSRDEWGGWTLPIVQFWFGHRARKATWLYIVGVEPRAIPPMPMVLGEATHVVSALGRNRRTKWSRPRKPELSKSARERTPPEMARWLIELARSARSDRVAA